MKWKWIFVVPAGLFALAVFAFIGGEIVRQLWNWLLPALFGLPAITFWQALGLLALARILVGGCGFGGGGRSRGPRGRHWSDRVGDRIADRVADRVAERWEGMTPEERDRVRQRLNQD